MKSSSYFLPTTMKINFPYLLYFIGNKVYTILIICKFKEIGS